MGDVLVPNSLTLDITARLYIVRYHVNGGDVHNSK